MMPESLGQLQASAELAREFLNLIKAFGVCARSARNQ